MQILNPFNLWFLLAIPLIILFYILAPRFKTMHVSSLQFWSKNMERGARQFKWRKFYHDRHLYLQALSILLLVCALLNPVINLYAKSPDTHVLIFDTSASMKSFEGDISRMDIVRDNAFRTLSKWTDGKIVIIRADAEPEILFSGSISEKEKIKDVIKTLQARDNSSRLISAVQMATVQRKGKGDITLFTDGSSPETILVSQRHREVNIELSGKSNRNISINSLTKTDYDNGVIVQVKNHGDHLERFNVELLVDERPAGIQEVVLGDGEESPLYFPITSQALLSKGTGNSGLQQRDGGIVEARISTEDALPADNRAWYIWPYTEEASVLLVTYGNKKLEGALKANKNWDVKVTGPESYETGSDNPGRFDLLIFDHYRPLTASHLYSTGKQGVVFIVPPVRPGEDALNHENIKVQDWDGGHPVMRFIKPEEIRIPRASVVAPPPWAEVLLKGDIPLIYAMSESSGRTIVIGFDPFDSNFAKTPYFPLFLMNAIRWLKMRGNYEGIHAGDMYTMKVPASFMGNGLWVAAPDGSKEWVPLREGFIRYGTTYKAGVYTIYGKGSPKDRFEKRFAVNIDSGESDIRPVILPEKLSINNKLAGSGNSTSLIPLWSMLTLFASFLIIVEWGLREDMAGTYIRDAITRIRDGFYHKSVS